MQANPNEYDFKGAIEMRQRIASCACGSLNAVATAEPLRVAICHCNDCRARTGSAFSWNARFAADAIRLSGESRSFARTGDEGSVITYHFCPNCGVTVWYENDQSDGIAIPVGTFAPGDLPVPQVSVYDDRKPEWIDLAAHDMQIWN